MKILIAEDEQSTSKFYYEIFRRRGHQVDITSNGRECVSKFRLGVMSNDDSDFPYDVVILDYVIPLKSGVEVAREILKLNPSQRIIFISAYPNQMLSEFKDSKNVIEFLSKPFSLTALINVVEDRKKKLKDKIPEFQKWDGLSGISEAFGAAHSTNYK